MIFVYIKLDAFFKCISLQIILKIIYIKVYIEKR